MAIPLTSPRLLQAGREQRDHPHLATSPHAHLPRPSQGLRPFHAGHLGLWDGHGAGKGLRLPGAVWLCRGQGSGSIVARGCPVGSEDAAVHLCQE